MNERDKKSVDELLILCFLAAVLVLVVIAAMTINTNEIPRCQEDAVLVGAGDFEDGRWDYYICGPALDDYVPPAPTKSPDMLRPGKGSGGLVPKGSAFPWYSNHL